MFTRRQALAVGYGARAIRDRLASGIWLGRRRGVYVTRAHWEAADATGRHAIDVAAAILSFHRHDAAGSHHSAARIYGIETVRPPLDVVGLTRPPGAPGRGESRGVRVERAGLPLGHVRLERGVPLTTPLKYTAPDRLRAENSSRSAWRRWASPSYDSPGVRSPRTRGTARPASAVPSPEAPYASSRPDPDGDAQSQSFATAIIRRLSVVSGPPSLPWPVTVPQPPVRSGSRQRVRRPLVPRSTAPVPRPSPVLAALRRSGRQWSSGQGAATSSTVFGKRPVNASWTYQVPGTRVASRTCSS